MKENKFELPQSLFSDVQKKVTEQKNKEAVLYTALMNSYDPLIEIENPDPRLDYICFTNSRNLQSITWKIIHIEFEYRDPRRLAKIFKVLPHRFLSAYNYSIWIDANCKHGEIIGDLIYQHLLSSNCGFALFKHQRRNCIYEEATVCRKWKKDNAEIIQQQMEKYRQAGYPKDNSLSVGRVLIRKHNEKSVIDLMEDWWEEIDQNSVRDQLSLSYVQWKNNYKAYFLPFRLDDNKYLVTVPHPKTFTYDDMGNAKFHIRTFIGDLIIKLRTMRNI